MDYFKKTQWLSRSKNNSWLLLVMMVMSIVCAKPDLSFGTKDSLMNKNSHLTLNPSGSWMEKLQHLHRLRQANLDKAKVWARVYLKDPALLVRAAAVEVLAESLLAEDIPLLKQQMVDERNYHKGRALFVVNQVQQILNKHELISLSSDVKSYQMKGE